MTKILINRVWYIRNWNLDIFWNLACLLEVPPCGTKAGIWDLVLPVDTMLYALCVFSLLNRSSPLKRPLISPHTPPRLW